MLSKLIRNTMIYMVSISDKDYDKYIRWYDAWPLIIPIAGIPMTVANMEYVCWHRKYKNFATS